MVKLMEQLSAVMGEEVLERLAGIQTGRGPLLSRRPAIDYRMGNDDRRYTNHPVADTGWYVLTHSDRHEKIALITRIIQHLQLPEGLLSVRSEASLRSPRTGPVIRVISDDAETPTTQADF